MSNRVTYDDKGRLDEVVTDAGAHLERLSRDTWFLSMERSDGSSFCVWFHGHAVLTEERAPTTDEATPTNHTGGR